MCFGVHLRFTSSTYLFKTSFRSIVKHLEIEKQLIKLINLNVQIHLFTDNQQGKFNNINKIGELHNP
jgi:hypothetical protein